MTAQNTGTLIVVPDGSAMHLHTGKDGVMHRPSAYGCVLWTGDRDYVDDGYCGACTPPADVLRTLGVGAS